jgi:hypothetical protein
MPRQTLILLLALTAGMTHRLAAQVEREPRPFVSIHTGWFWAASKEFTELFENKPSRTYGGSVGYPVARQLVAFIRLTYLEASGTVGYPVYNYPRPPYYVPGVGKSSIQMWILNPGVERSVPLFGHFDFAIDAGPLVGFAKEVRPTGGYAYGGVQSGEYGDEHDVTLVGVFGGLRIERRFEAIGLSLNMAGQHSHASALGQKKFFTNYGGGMLMFALRYDF